MLLQLRKHDGAAEEIEVMRNEFAREIATSLNWDAERRRFEQLELEDCEAWPPSIAFTDNAGRVLEFGPNSDDSFWVSYRYAMLKSAFGFSQFSHECEQRIESYDLEAALEFVDWHYAGKHLDLVAAFPAEPPPATLHEAVMKKSGWISPVLRITWDDLVATPGTHNPTDLLSAWRWLLGDEYQIVLISALGDLFLADAIGRIHWLDVGTGRLTLIAGNLEEFDELQKQPAYAEEWFVPELVDAILESGVRLEPGQCLSYKVPPVLGGRMIPSNFERTDLAVHLEILGQIHKQIKDLPPGTPIGKIDIKKSTSAPKNWWQFWR